MAHIVKVEGIELFATARGHSLECDECGDTYIGGNHEDRGGPYQPNGYRSIDRQQIVEDAMRLGWTGLEKYQDPSQAKGTAALDLCPVCSAMRKAPYWPTHVHEPKGIGHVMYNPAGPLVQRHTVVRPLEKGPFGVTLGGWPLRDRYNEPPAILDIKFTASENGVSSIYFDSSVRWPSRKRGEGFKSPAPMIRLWSWGDGKVYAKELNPPSK
jgi:hypothetical protein